MELMLSLVFGTVGLAYAVYGKRAEEYGFLIFGVLLMVYSYFIRDLLGGSIAGAVLVAGPFALKRYL